MNDVSIASNPVKRLSALAQLVQLLSEQGNPSITELVARTGYSERQIQRARCELREYPWQSGTAREAPSQSRCASTLPIAGGDADVMSGVTPMSSLGDADVTPPHPSPPLKERSPPAPPLKKIHPTPSATTFSESRAAREKARCADQEVSEKEPQNSWNPRTGKLTLGLAERAYWVPKLGGEEALDLALMQAANYLQINSGKTLLVQVRAQLSRTVALKKQADERYRLRVVQGGKQDDCGVNAYLAKVAAGRQEAAAS
jgi:hypothetical protein